VSRNGQPVFCPRLLSIDGAAAYLGISATTFRQIAPRLPILRCGRRVLYDRAVLDAFVERFQPGQDITVDKRTDRG